jgi:hypothetical protein
VAAFYYVMTLRTQQQNTKNTLDTRQAQLLMQIYQKFSDTEFFTKWGNVLSLEIRDYDDFIDKVYGMKRQNREIGIQLGSLFAYFEGIGVLIEEKLVDAKLVANLMSGNIVYFWEKYGPFITEYRRRTNNPREWNKTEYLYGEMMKLRGGDWAPLSSNVGSPQ